MKRKNRPALRQRTVLQQHETDARLDGKLCVITGATSGVGLAAARRLAAGGANLYLLARSREKAEAVQAELTNAYHTDVRIAIADFAHLADVRRAAQEIISACPVIDVLINCAGLFSTRRRESADGHELTFQVNHLASFLLTMLLLPRILQSPQGRILQVNSFGHHFGGLNLDDLAFRSRPYFWPRVYGASKLAQLMTMHTLAARLAGTGVTINAIHPGTVGSNIVQYSGRPMRFLMYNCKRYLLKDPCVSGEALYYLAAAPELTAATGRYYSLTIEKKPAALSQDAKLCARVWEISLALTGLPPGEAVGYASFAASSVNDSGKPSPS